MQSNLYAFQALQQEPGAQKQLGVRYGDTCSVTQAGVCGDLEKLEDAVLQVLQLASVCSQGQQQALLGLLQLPPLLSHHLPQQLCL